MICQMIKDAEWICADADFGGVCPSFTKLFTAKKEIKKASLSVTAAGVYEACLNGKRVGNFVFAPGCTSYETRLQFQTYDITDMLQDNNTLDITVGSGWYSGRIGKPSPGAPSPKIVDTPCAVIAEAEIEYVDGTSNKILTDSSWGVLKSNILFSDIYDGETYNAMFSDDTLYPVKTLDLTKDNIIPQQGEIVCEHERIKPVGYFTTPNGEKVVDFGQNLAGYVEFTIDAKQGFEVELSHAEVLDRNGNFYTENYRTAKSKIKYICGSGRQTYKPHFTFMGFRYIRLDNFAGEVNLDNFTAIAVYSDIKQIGYIKTGNAKINKLFENSLWSQKSNFLDIPTDCPQRDERMGWTGDAQVFAKTAGYNYNVLKFFKKWLGDVRAQQRANGAVPDTVPNFWQHDSSSAAWGDAICIIPWQMYLLYGDKQILEDNFDAMRKWVSYITGDTLDKYLWTCKGDAKGGTSDRKHYGDWLALDAPYGSFKGSTDEDFIASAFYAYSVSLVVKTGKVLGRNVSEYADLYKNIVQTFKKRFSNFKTQTEHVLALYFNLTDDIKKTADSLANMIEANGNRLKTGFVGTPYLLHVLSQNGHADTAYSLLLQEDYPSWLYEVNNGATTIWEHWDSTNDKGEIWPSSMNSYNHYAYGSVMDWVYSVAAGIHTSEDYAGFEKLVIAPVADSRLGWIDVSYETPHGKAISKWTYENGALRYEITTPSEASIIIDGHEYNVSKGSYVFYKKL